MTRFTVVWNADLEAEFANTWLASDSQTRAVLTETANWIDKYLAEDADIKGQWRPSFRLTQLTSRYWPRRHMSLSRTRFDQRTDRCECQLWSFAENNDQRKRAHAACRKHVTRWSLTMPTACMCA